MRKKRCPVGRLFFAGKRGGFLGLCTAAGESDGAGKTGKFVKYIREITQKREESRCIFLDKRGRVCII